jgi:hypothetical protein
VTQRCNACPVAPDRPCVAERLGWAWPCEFAGLSDVHRLHVVNRSAIDEANPMPEPEIDPAPIIVHPFPGLATMAVNFGKAVVTHVASGLATVPDDVFDDRMTICRACEYHDPDSERCRACGCPVASKARMASQRCPLPEPKWVELSASGKCGGCGSK